MGSAWQFREAELGRLRGSLVGATGNVPRGNLGGSTTYINPCWGFARKTISTFVPDKLRCHHSIRYVGMHAFSPTRDPRGLPIERRRAAVVHLPTCPQIASED